MKGNGAARSYQRRHLVDDSLWLRNIHQHQPSGGQVKRFTGKASGFSISLKDLDIPDVVVRQMLSGQRHRVRIDLDANHGACRPHPLREDFETSQRAATDLHGAKAGSYADAIE